MDVPPAAPDAPAHAMPPASRPTAPRQRLATASLTLGILGNLGLGPFAGIPAVITGHLAFARARRNPATHGGRGTAIAGFVLGYVSFLLGLPVLAILLSAVAPTVQRSLAAQGEARCAAQLRELATRVRHYTETHDQPLPRDFEVLKSPTDTSLTPFHCPETRGPGYRPTRYDLLAPEATEKASGPVPILRCPAHGHSVSTDGSVHPGKPGRDRRRGSD